MFKKPYLLTILHMLIINIQFIKQGIIIINNISNYYTFCIYINVNKCFIKC